MFAYARPTSLAETFTLLREEPDARLLCGGTDLLVSVRKGNLRPPLVIDLKGVADLASGITPIDGGVRVAATTVLTELIADALIRALFPALVEAAMVVGSIQIRNRATLAGNVCNASPAADTAPPLLAYGARVEIAGANGVRRLPLTEFFVGPGRTVLERGELVSAIELPTPASPTGSAFGRMTRRRGVDLATVNLCCLVTHDGVARFGFGAVGPRPFLVTDETGVLGDPGAAPDERDGALRGLTGEATPISNVRASREYRQEMLFVLSRRALVTALGRLEEGRHGR